MSIINAKLDAEFESAEKSAKKSLHLSVTFLLINFCFKFFATFSTDSISASNSGFLYPYPERLSDVKIMKIQAINNLTL